LKCHKERLFLENDIVRVRNTQANSNTERWILGIVVKVCGPRTYLVRTGHKTRYVHADHLIREYDKVPFYISEVDICVPELCEQSSPIEDVSLVSNSVPQPPVIVTDKKVEPSLNQESVDTSPVVLRRSQRIRKPVDRLTL